MSEEQKHIIELLHKMKPELSVRFFVCELGVFGSLSNGDFTDSSDIDILVDFDQPAGWAFFDLKVYLEEKLGRKVDLVTKRSIRPEWKEEILANTLYV